MVDYSTSKQNRFLHAGTEQNRRNPPNKMVHYYNAPLDATHQSIAQVILVCSLRT